MPSPRARFTAATGMALALGACTAAPPLIQPMEMAAPPVVAMPPLRPEPPFSASPFTEIPARDTAGIRQTINAGLNSTETLWNLRSAWNVAALNCLSSQYAPITDGYRAFLETNEGALAAANSNLDEQFRVNFGGNYKRTRDSHTTRLYNYFALPPARLYFCDAVLGTAQRYGAAPPADIDSFAAAELAQIEQAFDRFYGEFEQYQVDRVEWQNVYGPEYGAVYAPLAPAPAPPAEAPIGGDIPAEGGGADEAID